MPDVISDAGSCKKGRADVIFYYPGCCFVSIFPRVHIFRCLSSNYKEASKKKNSQPLLTDAFFIRFPFEIPTDEEVRERKIAGL